VTNNHYNYSQGWGVKFGYLGCFRYFSVGASYKPKTKMAKFSQYKGFIAEEGSIDVPPMYRVGVAFYPLCGVTVAADFHYIEYSRIPALHNPFVPNLFTYLLGSADGAGFDWSDQRFWRFGINWDINCDWSVRAGYRTANVTFDKPDGNVLTLDTTVDFVVIGGSWRCLDGAEISAFVGHGFNRKISGDLPPFPTFGGMTTIEQNRTAFGLALGWCY
jgi:long-chain fatty acid transport protein